MSLMQRPKSPDPDRCHVLTSSGDRWHRSQCLRRADGTYTMDLPLDGHGDAGFVETVPVCKQHHDAPKRAAEREARYRAERERADALEAAAKRRAAALGGGAPDYSWSRRCYTGGVTLTAEQADALIARLEGTT